MIAKLEKAINLRSEKKFNEAERTFIELTTEHPEDGSVFYHYAWLCDNMEREMEALPKYEKALSLGLSKEDLEGCFLGLGSTYRCIGQYNKAIAILERAISEFPNNDEFKVFKAMALYNVQAHEDAMNLLLNVIANTSTNKGILNYKKAILHYSDKLDKVFC